MPSLELMNETVTDAREMIARRAQSEPVPMISNQDDIWDLNQAEPSIPTLRGTREEQVLSNITHDLRGPLSAIMGYLDLVGRQMEKSVTPKTVEYISRAREAGQRLQQMMNDMLDMYHCENGQRSLQFTKVPVDSILTSVRNTFAGLAQLKNVNLICAIDKEAPACVWADLRYLIRVLDNLVANAIKFTPAGGSVELLITGAPGEIIFKVSDTGCGIPLSDQKLIFERYHQVNSHDRERGYGMGLAVVKSIIEAHCGKIHVKSELGAGSQFIFSIPHRP